MTPYNEIVAVETPVTDYLYDEARANKELRHAFLCFLKPECPPRKGENILLSAEEWQEKLLEFSKIQDLNIGEGSPAGKAIAARNIIFGEPLSIRAGGASANSFDVLVKSQIDGIPLTGGSFVTAVGEGVSGDVFAGSLEGFLIIPKEHKGKQLEAHVFPIEGDRVLISMPSFVDPPSNYMSSRQLDQVAIDENTKMVMLGGYMLFTGKYNEFFDKIVKKVAVVSDDPSKRPTIVLTAAAQEIAASPVVQDAMLAASKTAPLLVFSNAGEFRRLHKMDAEWRKPHEDKWIGLEENDLEKAKEADEPYKADKRAANQVAFHAVYESLCKNGGLPVTFVVTDGKKGVHVISNEGVSDTYVPPEPPHGVKNTVGAGDGFAAGYMLGHLKGLAQQDSVALGFICSGEVIGRDEARLEAVERTHVIDGRSTVLKGLPAYLDPQDPHHKSLLLQLGLKVEPMRHTPKPANEPRRFFILNV